MSVTQQQIITALKRIRGPDLESNIVDLGLVSEIVIRDGRVSFSITVPPERAAELDPLREAAQQVTSELPGVTSSLVVLTADRASGKGPSAPNQARTESARVAAARAAGGAGARPAAAAPTPAHSHDHGHAHGNAQGHAHGPGPGARAGAAPGGAPRAAAKAGAVPGVKHLIAVASGKGGVGKSTLAVNLALAFRAMGLKTGIMDADIYGPSQAKLLGISGKPTIGANKKLQPLEAYGLRAMSMGLLVDEGTPLVLRGPMGAGI
jgi:ATP-binding protein involved in chromosome partitioning